MEERKVIRQAIWLTPGCGVGFEAVATKKRFGFWKILYYSPIEKKCDSVLIWSPSGNCGVMEIKRTFRRKKIC